MGSIEQIIEKHKKEIIIPYIGRGYLKQWVERDQKEIRKALPKARHRRGTPRDSVPAEVYQLALVPWYISKYKAVTKKLGVGARPEKFKAPITNQLFDNFLTHIRASGHPPVVAHVSEAWQIDKRNGVQGQRGIRLVHGFDPLWKTAFKMWYTRVPPKKYVPYVIGGLANIRREEGMSALRTTA